MYIGKEHVGKSTLIKYLEFQNPSFSSITSHPTSSTETLGSSKDLGLSYSICDLNDEDTHETLSRIEFFQLSSPSPSYTQSLLPFQTESFLSNLYVCILLDWTTPHIFLPELREWFKWLHSCIEPCSSEAWYIQLQKQLSIQFQTLCNSTLPSSVITEVPLPEGMLKHNLGFPISIICSKSDLISTHIHDGTLSNDYLDALQYAFRKEAFA
ncbi:hypothetical protein HMI54_012690, partial [Coelomomyces lativittatus]